MDTMLATIGIVVKEPWAVDISYEMLNYTLYAVEAGGDGCGYIALKDNIGVTPGSDETVWRKAVQAGQSIYDLAVKYHHFVGTEEEFEAQYQAALQAALDAAAGASAVEAQVEAAEALRVQAESSRESAETARAAAESARDTAEDSREAAESSRASAESSRVSAETGRSEAETARQTAETTRQSNEEEREEAEGTRTQQFEALKADMQVAIGQADAAATAATEAAASAAQTESDIEAAEASRVTAEQGRVTAEQGRASAEQGRVSSESARVTAETARETQAGADHTRAGSDHTQAGTDHTQAAADHSRAESDNTQAGADHTQAVADHTQAESDHTVVEGYNTRLTNVESEVSQLGQKITTLDIEINSVNETVYENIGQVAYYEENGFPTGWYGTGTYTPLFTEDKIFNAVKFPPFNTGYTIAGETKFYIAYGNRPLTSLNPTQNLTLIKEGVIPAPTSYRDIIIHLDDFVRVPSGNRVYVFLYTYITGSASHSLILGGGTDSDRAPELYSQDDPKAYFIASGAETSPFNISWSIATPSGTSALYRVCAPILLLNVKGVKENVSEIQEDIETLQEDVDDIVNDVDDIVNDTDETKYENVGEWEHYAELGNLTGWKGTGTTTPALENDVKINCICIPTFRIYANSDVKYYIGYRPYSTVSFNPSSATLLKSGIIANVPKTTKITDTKIYLDEPITVPAGNQVVVLLYSQNSNSVDIIGGGMSDTEVLPYNNKVQRAFLIASTTVLDDPFAINWYVASETNTDKWKVCTPILKLEQDSVVTKRINELVPPMLEEEVPELVEEAISADSLVDVYLPNKLYAVVGDTLQIFFQGIVAAINLEQYDIYAVCDKGKTYPRYFSYTPTVDDIGTNTLTIYVKDRKNNILGQASCSLVTVVAPISPSASKSIFTFGDSLTSPGIWVGEAKRRLVGTSTYDSIQGKGLSNLSFFGYMSKTIHDQPVNYYGVGGWTWLNYITKATGGAFRFYVSGVNQLSIGAVYTNNGYSYTIQEINVTGDSGNIRCTTSANTNVPSTSGTLTKTDGEGDATITFDSFETENMNPLWDDVNNKMSFIPYVQDCGANTIDAVYVLLTWNGHAAWKEYSADDTTGHIANAKTFARTLHAEYPNAKLFIMGIQMPSDTGGLGANYGATGGLIDGYGLKQCALNYNKALQDLCNLEEFSSYCEFVAIAPQFDTHYNMPYTMAKVNIRNTATEMLGLNGVHPSEQGYNQIADAVYRSIVANYCH